MEPVDDEARAISDKESVKWIHPIDSLPGQGYGDALLAQMQKQLDAIARGQTAPVAAPVSSVGVDPDAFARLQTQVAELMEANARLQAQIAEPAEEPARRV
jgi:hypothetical protein